MIVGVTGGVAMGKSKVALKLNELFPNSQLFDADGVVSQLLTRENICKKVRKVFGDVSIDASGLINRAFLREQVFDSAEQRAKLENILHPEVKNEFDIVFSHLILSFSLLNVIKVINANIITEI